MMRFLGGTLVLLLCLWAPDAKAKSTTDSLNLDAVTEAEFYELAYQAYLDSVAATLTYETGLVSIGEGLATIAVPAGFRYLGPAETKTVLTDMWGNPPSELPGLGMLFPVDQGPNDQDVYAIEISYLDDGHVNDEGATDIDYDELLEGLQEDTRQESAQRAAMGYGTVKLLDWASAPYYDQANKKLHWAMELQFDDAAIHTLNYNIRILGREGYLLLNAIGDMNSLEAIQQNIQPILKSVDFTAGNRYTDYRPSVDRLAAYGVGGLIAGKVLAKAGLFAKIGILLAKGWKLVLLALVGIVAVFRRVLGR